MKAIHRLGLLNCRLIYFLRRIFRLELILTRRLVCRFQRPRAFGRFGWRCWRLCCGLPFVKAWSHEHLWLLLVFKGLGLFCLLFICLLFICLLFWLLFYLQVLTIFILLVSKLLPLFIFFEFFYELDLFLIFYFVLVIFLLFEN